MGVEARWLDDGCCGMAGAFGFEAGEHYDVSVKAGELALLPARARCRSRGSRRQQRFFVPRTNRADDRPASTPSRRRLVAGRASRSGARSGRTPGTAGDAERLRSSSTRATRRARVWRLRLHRHGGVGRHSDMEEKTLESRSGTPAAWPSITLNGVNSERQDVTFLVRTWRTARARRSRAVARLRPGSDVGEADVLRRHARRRRLHRVVSRRIRSSESIIKNVANPPETVRHGCTSPPASGRSVSPPLRMTEYSEVRHRWDEADQRSVVVLNDDGAAGARIPHAA